MSAIEVCEGTITNVFVEKDGVLITPPLTCGLLPGVLRQELLENGEAKEAVLTLDDLKKGFYLGNSLRGLIGGGSWFNMHPHSTMAQIS